MNFFYENIIDADGVLFAASSEVSTLPASNLAHEFRKKVWRTGSTSAAEYVVIDLGIAQNATACILLDHDLTVSDSQIAIQANSSDSWGAPPVNQALTWQAGAIGETFGGGSYRYWRLIFTKSSANESRSIGRLFLGTYYLTPEQPDFDGYDEQLNDLARKQKTLSGQTYTEIVDKGYTLRCDFSKSPNTMAETLRAIAEEVGESISFFVQIDEADPIKEFWYVKLSKALKRRVSGYDGSLYWDLSLEFEEQL